MRIRIQQTLYKTVEERHAAQVAEPLIYAWPFLPCVAFCATTFRISTAPLCGHDYIKKVKNEAHR